MAFAARRPYPFNSVKTISIGAYSFFVNLASAACSSLMCASASGWVERGEWESERGDGKRLDSNEFNHDQARTADSDIAPLHDTPPPNTQ